MSDLESNRKREVAPCPLTKLSVFVDLETVSDSASTFKRPVSSQQSSPPPPSSSSSLSALSSSSFELRSSAPSPIRALAGVYDDLELYVPQIRTIADARWALQQLAEFAGGARYVVGHNIITHDLSYIRRVAPSSTLLDKPVIDTLYLSPLATPQRPYHHLVKDYKLVSAELSDPFKDCIITQELFEDCWALLRDWGIRCPGLLDVYRTCFIGDNPAGDTETFLASLGGRRISDVEVEARFAELAAGKYCRVEAAEHIIEILQNEKHRPAVAYALAWLLVVNTESVLPRWVQKKFPPAAQLLRSLRSVACSDSSCEYCRVQNDPKENLRRFFSFTGFRATPATPEGDSLQERIATTMLDKQPLLGIMPTGGGKSLCFQLPAIIRYKQYGALTIVVSPLQALMKDQVDNLNVKTGSPSLAATLNGLQTMPERKDTLEGVRLGRFAILYVSPEQLRNKSFRKTIRYREIASWVLDEAHCLSQWGHDFRTDYYYTGRFIKEFSEEEEIQPAPVACFTATAKFDVRNEICAHFKENLDQDITILAADRVDRKNLTYQVEKVTEAQKEPRIHKLLTDKLSTFHGEKLTGAAIIYVRTRPRSEKIALALKKRGWPVKHFHAGMELPEKRTVQEQFVSGELPVIVATNTFGMGIDKANVRLVVHADVPASLENYLQEAGRAGRDGLAADCVLLFSEGDLNRQFSLLSRNHLSKRDISQILSAIRRVRKKWTQKREDRQGDYEEVVVSVGDLLRVPGISTSFRENESNANTKIKVAISWLERARFLLRNENSTFLFQGVPAVSDGEAEEKIAGLNLSRREAGMWSAVVKCLQHTDQRKGVSIDHLLTLPAFKTLFEQLHKRFEGNPRLVNEEAKRKIIGMLYQMSEVGILERGIYFTAWYRHKIRDNSLLRLQRLHKVQTSLCDVLEEHFPELGENREAEVPLSRLKMWLRKSHNVEILNENLLKLLEGWERQGFSDHAPVSLKSIGHGLFHMSLSADYQDLRNQLELRNEAGTVVLRELGKSAESLGLERGEHSILFALENIGQAFKADTRLSSAIKPSFAILEKVLLFLDEHQIIRLENGLSLFRQAMHIELQEKARNTRERYKKSDYKQLDDHYQARVFQVHAIGRYAAEASSDSGEASRDFKEADRDSAEPSSDFAETGQAFVENYFKMPQNKFRRRYFPDLATVERAVSKDRYEEIVNSLGNDAQERIVTAPRDRNMLVLAGPGSGKTRVVVHRCAYLLEVKRIPPENIIVVCFNRTAMYELRSRLRKLVGDDLVKGLAVHTYHSLALRICERSLIEERQAAGTDSHQRGKDDSPFNKEEDEFFKKMLEDANRRLRGEEEIEGVDADEIRDRLLAGYEYVLIDEYQDIDSQQYEMITHIARKAGRDEDRYAAILAVGDDDQAIYRFRGANVEFIQRYRKDFDAQIHYLVENYRSTANIISTSNRLISHNEDRMKKDHPIQIDKERENDPRGGEWATLDRIHKGKVRIRDVEGPVSECTTVAAYIERTKERSKSAGWPDFAILGRTHEAVDFVRAYLENRNIPTKRPVPYQMPSLRRIREFRKLLEHLEQSKDADVKVSTLRRDIETICGATYWTVLADRLLAEIEQEVGESPCPVSYLIRALYEQLGMAKREHVIGEGVLVGTLHSAKGREFSHVIILGSDWRYGDDVESERRLFYVGMTRAKDTLLIINRTDSPLPCIDEVTGQNEAASQSVDRRDSLKAVGSSYEERVRVAYEILGLRDVDLGYAGRKHNKHQIHRALIEVSAGDTTMLNSAADSRNPNQRNVLICDEQNRELARLSKRAVKGKWPKIQDIDSEDVGEDTNNTENEGTSTVEDAKVIAMVSWTIDDTKKERWRQYIKTDRWEVPIVEVRYRQMDQR